MILLVGHLAFGTIASTSGSVLYVDSSGNVSPHLLGNYISLKITNDTGSAIPDAWVKVDTFTGAYVSLGVNEDGLAHLGPMATGASRTIFVYLNVNCSSFSAGQCDITTAQPFTARLYSGPPTSGTQLQSQALSLTVQETTAAQANKVTTVVTSTNDPVLGSLVTVTVSGNTGTIGSAKSFYASPETYFDFPANVFKLYTTSITFSGANTGTYNDLLLVPSSAFSSSSATDYSFNATYMVHGMNPLTTPISPVAFISSGTQIKHTDTSGYASLSPIPPTSNTLVLSKSVNTSIMPSGGVATYTLRATNSGSASVVLDDFTDNLPVTPASVTYVSGSSTVGGSAISNPIVSGNQLKWSGTYTVPANGILDLTYQANIPATNGTYTNSAVAHVGTTQVDTTITTADNVPATAAVGVGSPDLTLTSTHTGNFAQGQTSASYKLTVSNIGSVGTVSPVVVADSLPASLTLTSISGTGWTCSVVSASCTRADSLPASSSYPPITVVVSVSSSAPASVINTVSVTTAGETNTTNNTAVDATTIVQAPDLTISSTHSGSFTQGQSGSYSVVVSNVGAGPTTSSVTVQDVLPAGLSATTISGTGWTCNLVTLSCSRSDSLAAGSSYPAISISVDVAPSAAPLVNNTASVSGGGEFNTANSSTTDATTITQVPVLTVTSTHTGNFVQDQTGASYTIAVANVGSGATSGTITVSDTLPAGITVQSVSGSGWTCTTVPIVCTRADVLGPNSAFPVITVVVDVSRTATSPLVNNVSVVGGGQATPANGSDTTVVTPFVPYATNTALSVAPSSSVQAGTAVTLTAAVTRSGNPVVPGVVNFCDATASQCSGAALFGSAQLDSNGNASITTVLPAGTYNVKAVFEGNTDDQKSTSSTEQIVVTAGSGFTSTTKLSSSGSAGNYSFTADVAAIGAPGLDGKVTFTDSTLGTLGEVTLDSTKSGYALKAAASQSASTDGNVAGLLADFNDDGLLDLVTANTSSAVAIRLGNGDGTFQSNSDYPIDSTKAVRAITKGDFNGDGKLDFAVVSVDSSTQASSVRIMLGNGDGTFQAGNDYALGSNSKAIASADVSGDGDADLVVVNADDNNIGVLLGNGDGTFQPQMTFATGSSPQSLVIAELNGDDKADIVTTNQNDDSVSVLLGNGDGTYQAPTAYATGIAPSALSLGDVNGDSLADVVVAPMGENTLSVLLGNGDGTFQPKTSVSIANSADAMAVDDFNGDGKTDIAISSASAGTVSVLLGNGDATFDLTSTISSLISPSVAMAADLNSDGLADVLSATQLANNNLNVLISYHTQTATISGVNLDALVHTVTATYSGDSYRAGSSDSLSVGAPIASTTTALSVSPNPGTVGSPVTLTATVSPSGACVGGTVNFYADGVLLGSAQCDANGVATFTVSSLSSGIHSLTAVYGGDSLHAASTSNAVATTINDPTRYNVVASQTPFPVVAGNNVDIDVLVPPVGGSFTNEVTLSASGLPAGYTVTFSPAKVTPGANGVHSTMTVKTPSQLAGLHGRSGDSLLGFLGLAFGICVGVRNRKYSKRGVALALSFVAFIAIGMTGCGGGFAGKPVAPSGPASVTHVITITGTSGNLQASTTVTIVVSK